MAGLMVHELWIMTMVSILMMGRRWPIATTKVSGHRRNFKNPYVLLPNQLVSSIKGVPLFQSLSLDCFFTPSLRISVVIGISRTLIELTESDRYGLLCKVSTLVLILSLAVVPWATNIILKDRSIAVTVVGKSPRPIVTTKLALETPSYPDPNQGMGGYPVQQYAVDGPIGSALPGVPALWGPPVPPPYAHYPPPLRSTMYLSIPSQPIPPYGMQYPTSIPVASSGAHA
ncbi:hypothetical protein T459_02088 [Capsicum annuum]|uniref:Uncharacterized protein n=1 Tax=Capsicum annuum TaxID=4072 RepID=A0A2G3AIX8_CAPAN|nr:hypothetical protein T459_02088 [Capsicum annuum]